MRGNRGKDFLRSKIKSLIQSIRRIDKKWYPAIGLGTVAVLAAAVVIVFSVTDGLRLSGAGQGSQSANAGAGEEQKTMNGQGGGAVGENGVSYTPEELSKALEDLKGALASNTGKGKIHFKNPFANFTINIPTGTKKETSSASAGTTKKNSSNNGGGDTQPGTTRKETVPSKTTTTTGAADTTQSTAPPQTETEPEEPATQPVSE